MILDDPLGHCFVTPLEDDVADDDRLNVVEYVRTEDQDLEFGITQLRLMEEEEKQKLKQQGNLLTPSQTSKWKCLTSKSKYSPSLMSLSLSCVVGCR